MICQSCLQSTSIVDEVDMYNEFNGHEVCYNKEKVTELCASDEDKDYDKYEETIKELEDKIDTLKEKILEYEYPESVHYY